MSAGIIPAEEDDDDAILESAIQLSTEPRAAMAETVIEDY